MASIIDGWFSEVCPMWPGMALSVEIDHVIESFKSRYQQIDLFQTRTHGKMLVLDGIIQLTEKDEFAYHEMMAHVPLFAHARPEKVLVIGGGDGGILREASRHECVKSMDFCEIDEEVVRVSREHLPGTACGFDDPRVSIFYEDGAEFVKSHPETYDVIIVDSSDPVGPGEALFEKPFYEGVRGALRPGGIMAAQGESFFMHQECVTGLIKMTREVFKVQAYGVMMVPSYPGGNLGINLGSMGSSVKRPVRSVSPEMQKCLRYYTADVHGACFVLPAFGEKMFEAL